nr:hypothetical protein [uncultured Tyzzerella sp.]
MIPKIQFYDGTDEKGTRLNWKDKQIKLEVENKLVLGYIDTLF